MTLQVINNLGQVVHQENIKNLLPAADYKLNLNLPAGIYVIKMNVDDEVFVNKITIE
ncbi:MAG: hypothetical protein KatS3mg027_1749 [Bacteroidia bacterium]|nr:MAG: hypothetical protein KatS3mg027_1749 [Bacteroidia bacterium]